MAAVVGNYQTCLHIFDKYTYVGILRHRILQKDIHILLSCDRKHLTSDKNPYNQCFAHPSITA